MRLNNWTEPCGKGRKKMSKTFSTEVRKEIFWDSNKTKYLKRKKGKLKEGCKQTKGEYGISAEKKKQNLDDQKKQWIGKRKKVNTIKRKTEYDRTKQTAPRLEVELKFSRRRGIITLERRTKKWKWERRGQKRKQRWKKNTEEKNKATNFWLVDIFICSLATINYESENLETTVLHMLL